IVVAANRLGVINHLALTLEHAACRGLRVLGYILNRTERESSLAAETNREVLASLTAIPCFGELPYLDNVSAKALGDIMDEHLDLGLLQPVLWDLPQVS
ncbi:MAG TPA: AAA family ATPase, partial [Terriglobales bacterium]|nr:AAA family ATPase [Terriglobales bacterium]